MMPEKASVRQIRTSFRLNDLERWRRLVKLKVPYNKVNEINIFDDIFVEKHDKSHLSVNVLDVFVDQISYFALNNYVYKLSRKILKSFFFQR